MSTPGDSGSGGPREEPLDAYVQRRARRSAARRALQIIAVRVGETEAEIAADRKARRVVIAGLAVVAAVFAVILFAPGLARWVSALLD